VRAKSPGSATDVNWWSAALIRRVILDRLTTFGHAAINALNADVRTCGPGPVRIASGEDDNHFAGCASLTDMSKRGGNLVEREGAVDVDPDVPGNA
jgi:hypothetical protein